MTKDLSRAFSLFEQAATAGQADAQYEVAVRLEKGWGVGKDVDQALGWYRRAADQNHARAAKAAARLEAERAAKTVAETERETDEAAKTAFKADPLMACEAAVARVSEAARARGLSVHEAERRETAQGVHFERGREYRRELQNLCRAFDNGWTRASFLLQGRQAQFGELERARRSRVGVPIRRSIGGLG